MCLSTCFQYRICWNDCNKVHTDNIVIKSPLEDTVWIVNKTHLALCRLQSIVWAAQWLRGKKVREISWCKWLWGLVTQTMSLTTCVTFLGYCSALFITHTHSTDTQTHGHFGLQSTRRSTRSVFLSSPTLIAIVCLHAVLFQGDCTGRFWDS